ncbi:MAG TPA: polymer-forming cytoskeletal protein, partial [Flavobacterium sp.]|nr:polymer-forming cytoskeletal protein [Flavobacterium sp.]
CRNADIEGTFEGRITVAEILNVKSRAHIYGEVICGKLAVEPGAEFSASCIMKPTIKSLPPHDKGQQPEKAG